ncbi:MAG: DUF3619 family protein [Gammaproteobacteria bacterium]|nr:DUF3619 family protein [Gammaproteobacteria bacterium]
MNSNENDLRLLKKVRSVLDERAEQLDDTTCNRLRMARQQALKQQSQRAIGWQFPAASFATAAVVVLALGLWMNQPEQSVFTPTVMDDMELLSATDELEFYEELEFYQWLEIENDAA